MIIIIIIIIIIAVLFDYRAVLATSPVSVSVGRPPVDWLATRMAYFTLDLQLVLFMGSHDPSPQSEISFLSTSLQVFLVRPGFRRPSTRSSLTGVIYPLHMSIPPQPVLPGDVRNVSYSKHDKKAPRWSCAYLVIPDTTNMPYHRSVISL